MDFNHINRWLRRTVGWTVSVGLISTALLITGSAFAAGNDFDIQVSPSPLVVTLSPGRAESATLTVRNLTNHRETLYPTLKGFTTDAQTTNIKLVDTPPADTAQWVHFSQSVVSMAPGGNQQLQVNFQPPANAGFSYNLAVLLSRSPNEAAPSDGVHLRGAVAIFCLVNIDRPDASRQLRITKLTSDHGHYAFLPAHFSLTVKNSGNVIAQPSGTVFIQRSFDDGHPVAAIPFNQQGNYVLPGTSRAYTSTWQDGFPVYVTTNDGHRHLHWDWRRIGQLRIGKYVAKAVVVYNDGHRDVPVIASTSFWVIPWLFILVFLAVVIVLAMGLIGWGRLLFNGTKKVRSYAQARRK